MAGRVRGLAAWRPQPESVELIEQVQGVLDAYRSHLPLTVRQVFYRLVARGGYPKTEAAYERLGERLNRARRAGLIPFDAFRDDGAEVTDWGAGGYTGPDEFWQEMVETARTIYGRPPHLGQPRRLEFWVEAAGMVPQINRVVAEYGATVSSGSGFDSLTAKYDAAKRFVRRDVPTMVMAIGDLDPSGIALFEANAGDVTALAVDLGAAAPPEFHRLAVTREQVAEYGLPEAPAKETDKRGSWDGGLTVQAEAFDPADLEAIVDEAARRFTDLPALAHARAAGVEEREAIIAEVEAIRARNGKV